MAPYYQQQLIANVKEGPYALSIDGSTDTEVEKMNPLTARIFDPDHGIVPPGHVHVLVFYC